MASDSEMENTSDRSGIGDADSLASTAESEAEAEYLVNDIHAERRLYVDPDSEDDEGIYVTQYLVEWTGYSMDRCSWEPREMFSSEETLNGWEEKKRQILEGRIPSFNLKAWEKHMALLEKKTKKRKEDRRRKRKQRARQRSLCQAESNQLAHPDIADIHGPEAGTASRRASSRLSQDSTALALFVSAETPPLSKNATTRQSLQPRAPPRLVTSSAQTNWIEPPGSATLIAQTESTTPNKLSTSRLSQLAKKLGAKQKYPARQITPPQAAKPTLSSFGTGPGAKRAYRDHKWGERAPDLSQMELRRPSEFAPRMNIGFTTTAAGSSVTSPKSPRAQNQSASEITVSLAGPPTPQTGEIKGKAAKQLEKAVPLAPSSVLAPPVHRSSNLGSTALVSSSPVFSDPSALSNPERLVGPVGSTTSMSPPATQSKPLLQANLIKPADSVDTVVSTFSPPGEAALTNPAERSTSTLTAPSPSPYPRPPSCANIDRPTIPSASTSSVFPSFVLPGARAEATSIKPAAFNGSSPKTQSPAIPTMPPLSSVTTISSITALPKITFPTPSMVIALSSATVTVFSKVIALSTVIAPGSTVEVFFACHLLPPNLELEHLLNPAFPSRPKLQECRALGEILVHVFIGPSKRPLGAFRLCGTSSKAQSSLILAKNSRTNQVEIWFKHLCTVRDYERLCESSPTNSVLSTGWVEGFSDTNENLFHLAEDLRKDDLIAIHYPNGLSKLAWVAWSRGSKEFEFPRPKDEVPPGIPLLVAARTMLAPIEVLGSSRPGQSSGQSLGFLPDTSLSLRNEPATADGSLESGSSLERSKFHRDMRMSGSLQPREMPALARVQTFPLASELKDISISAHTQQQNNIAVQGVQLGQAAEGIMRARKINVEELAAIQEGGKLSKAGIFYLHFPQDSQEARQELQFLQLLLRYHEKIVFTSESPRDWAKFVQNSRQGVAIFHESFAGYDTLDPPLSSVLPFSSFNFWIVRIQRPLELLDPRFCSPTDYHLRIFPHGGVILLTEDMLTDLKGVAVTLQWIRGANKHKRKSWTLMFPPGILEWIETRLGDENFSQDHGLLLLIYTLIIKNNVTDPRVDLFDKASLHPNSKSNIIALSLDEYGTRTEHHTLKIKNKAERDADHLIELFAGWSLINIPRFRNFVAVTSFGPLTGPRWGKWGHMTVMRAGFGHFFKRFKIDSAALMAYLSGISKQRPSTSQVATPMTVTTPQTPNWTSHKSNAAIQSTFTCNPNGNGNGANKYAAPYK
ncbi:hypothetical protein PDIP_63150 [Penicillium digitatum Pd1]|uniref:Chromo domain-containing protein n=1 Tax=Penicillium digitatum (strain Pd1 / CECT 20795) TaxID=1170230 RepID=K9G9A2_PEND1|nr:hypothetical protein PDIP_63150 [Penicillium digitatum Pd1]EKV09821.1 hypothetical protein PDIP_63150 [Penicillium digitatum Pd1]